MGDYMGIYRKFEQLTTQEEIKHYKQIITNINEYYKKYSSFYDDNNNIQDSIEDCIKNGKSVFNSYFSDYLNSNVVDSEFLDLLELIETNKGKELNKSLERNNESIINKILQKYSKIEILNLNYSEKIDKLIEFFSENPELLEDKKIKALILILCGGVVDKYKQIIINYKQQSNKKIAEGKNVITSYSEIIDENNIKLNLLDMLNDFRNNSYYYEKIHHELKEKIITNKFIEETNRLRNIVKENIKSGKDKDEILKSILPDAYGLVKAAIEYSLSKTLYDVQIMGGIALNEGKIAEMYTGEGKTLTAILPAFLNSLTGREVDIFSSNDYLASRDAKQNSSVFNLLGLTVGCVKVDGQSIAEKKKAYSSDIIYGSSTAFAFDFLYDTNMDSQENLVQRELKPGYVIVDEADQILINNALSPYELEENGRPLSNRQKRENKEVIGFLTKAKELSDMLSKSTYTANNQYEFEIITGDNKEVTKRMEKKYSLLVGSNDVVITEKGERELFYNYMYDEIFDLSNKAKDYFIESGEYIEDKHYIIRDEKLVLTPDGLEKATKELSEFQDLNLKWLADPECQTIKRYVLNALTAEYLLERGKNYQVVTDDEAGKNKVVVLQDGRILPNSKFMNGIHQALELKEGIGVQIEQGESLLDSSLASISNRALLSRYDKVSGMTGTADKTAFKEIYQLETFEVPKNKEYQYQNGTIEDEPLKRNDLPVKLYKDDTQKFYGIMQDIKTCYDKGQPVLVVTDNEEDAIKISNMLSLPHNLLISGKNLEEESQIVSQAGMMYSITIATEMAGRGTDIKLGGDFDKVKNTLKEETIFTQAKREKIKNELKKYELSEQIRQTEFKQFKSIDELFDWLNKVIDEDHETIRDVVKKLENKYINNSDYRRSVDSIVEGKYEYIREHLTELGGIKYIQMNPFKTTRNDNQGKGRVARQGEPGETITYCSFEDLVEIGVDKSELNELSRMIGDKDSINDNDWFGYIQDTIENAQLKNEFDYDLQIASTDTMDFAVSALGLSILKSRKEILAQKDLNNVFDNMIDSVINMALKDCVPTKKQKKIDNDRIRLSRFHLDNENLYNIIKDTFGIQLDFDEISFSCFRIGELKDFIYDRVKEKQKEINLGLPEKRVNDKLKSVLTNGVNNLYSNFIYSAENVRLQEMNDILGQNGSHDRTVELNNIYKECIQDEWIHCVTSIFKPNLKKKTTENKFDVSSLEIPMYVLPKIEDVTKKTR